jgi:hypothetical protein
MAPTIYIISRQNNMFLVCLYLSLYISSVAEKKMIKNNVQIIKMKYIMTNINTQKTDYSIYIIRR